MFSRDTGDIAADEENKGIWIMNADGTGARQLTQLDQPGQGFDRAPQFSPGGRRLVFERHNVRDAEPVDGIALFVLDLGPARSTGSRRTSWKPVTRPTGHPTAGGSSSTTTSSADPDVSANLFTVRPNGTGLRQLTFETGGTVNYLGSSFSPDGRYITVGRRPETGGTNADVLVMRRDGTHVRHVTRTVLYDSYPDWGPRVHHH